MLVILTLAAVLLGIAVGVMTRDIVDQRRREREAAEATVQGRIKAGLRKGAERVAKETAKASRKGAWWALRRRFARKPKED